MAIQNVFERPYCTFRKCRSRLTHCKVNLYSFRTEKFLELSSKFCPLIYPNFFGQFFLEINFEKISTGSFECFVFIPFASTVLSNKSWLTSKNLTLLLSFANLSTYARSIHQISSFSLVKAHTPLSLRVACVNLVYQIFEYKNSLTFARESFYAFAKLRTEPYTANPCV